MWTRRENGNQLFLAPELRPNSKVLKQILPLHLLGKLLFSLPGNHHNPEHSQSFLQNMSNPKIRSVHKYWNLELHKDAVDWIQSKLGPCKSPDRNWCRLFREQSKIRRPCSSILLKRVSIRNRLFLQTNDQSRLHCPQWGQIELQAGKTELNSLHNTKQKKVQKNYITGTKVLGDLYRKCICSFIGRTINSQDGMLPLHGKKFLIK